MRNKLITTIILGSLVLFMAGPAEARDNRNKNKARQTAGVTLTNQQFQMLIRLIAERDAGPTIIPGVTGPMGEIGPQGDTGATGAQGAAGATGSQGRPGERGSDGQAGRDGERGEQGERGPAGVGFSPGAVFLVNGACPEGTTIQGSQNRWTVYANDTSGRPWTTTGSSAQLFLSACQVNQP